MLALYRGPVILISSLLHSTELTHHYRNRVVLLGKCSDRPTEAVFLFFIQHHFQALSMYD